MKFISRTKPVIMMKPNTDVELARSDWKDNVKTLFTDPRLVDMTDYFTLTDARAALISLSEEGESVGISDEAGKALAHVAKHPKTFIPAFMWGENAEEFFRTFVDAPSKDPKKEKLDQSAASNHRKDETVSS